VVTSTTITATTVSGTTPVVTDFLAYIQRDAGHIVVDVGQGVTCTFVAASGGSATVLTVSSVTSGTILIGMKFTFSGTENTITAQTSGTTGGAGDYTISSMSISSSTTFKSTSFQDGTNGSNKLGYSNFIIIRNNYSETDLKDKGQFNPVALSTALGNFISATPGLSTGRLLNTSHQLQLVFRVITRDLDATTKIRPDNM
jgi:hypothetical protein